jgi:hypothetical protein
VDWLLIAFRLLHIVSAVLWAGGAILFFLYIEPSIAKLGPDAEKFAAEFITRRRVPIYFAVVSTLTVLGGVLLYWRDSGGLQIAWITTPTGLALTVGAIAAIIAWLGGNLLIKSAVERVTEIGAEMKAAGGPPPAELMAQMHAAQERLHSIGLWETVLILVAVVAMSTARYLA